MSVITEIRYKGVRYDEVPLYLCIDQGRFPQCRRVTQTIRAKGQGGTTNPPSGRPICLGRNTEEEILGFSLQAP